MPYIPNQGSHLFPLDSQVLQDMLQLLKETVSSRHAERLEQIVIALIVVEIGMLFTNRTSNRTSSHTHTVLGIITIIVDLFA